MAGFVFEKYIANDEAVKATEMHQPLIIIVRITKIVSSNNMSEQDIVPVPLPFRSSITIPMLPIENTLNCFQVLIESPSLLCKSSLVHMLAVLLRCPTF